MMRPQTWLWCCSLATLYTIPTAGDTTPSANCSYETLSGNELLANCSSRDLLSIPANIHVNTTILDLSVNNITNLPNEAFVKLKHLKNISLAHNKIDAFNERAFDDSVALTYLDLSYNEIKLLLNDSFINLRNLRYLNMSSCKIMSVEAGALSPLSKLFLLNISYNFPNGLKLSRNISFGLQNTSIEVLVMDHMEETFGLGFEIKREDLLFFKNLTLKILSVNSNRIQLFEFGAISLLPDSLDVLHISDNTFSFGWYIMELKHLKLCIAYADRTSTFHKMPLQDVYSSTIHDHIKDIEMSKAYCSKTNETNIHQVNTLNGINYKEESNSANGNTKENINGAVDNISQLLNKDTPVDYFPPNMEQIFLRESNIDYAIPPFIVIPGNKITTINISHNIFYHWKGPVRNLHELKVLDMSSNYCYKISPDFFMDVIALEWLNVAQNFLGADLKSDINGRIFRNQKNLKMLNLHANRITSLPKNCFRGLESLEILSLSENSLTEWELDITHMKNITYIDLADNNLDVLPEETRNYLTEVAKRRNVTINLKGNTFECICDNVDFFKWLAKSDVIFENRRSYQCRDKDWVHVNLTNIDDEVNKLEKMCAKLTGLILGCSMAFSLFIIVLVSVLLYKKRWKLRYIYYMTIGRYSLLKEEPDPSYKYDAFVSYADEDQMFVRERMLLELEQRFLLKLCVHERDFTPGHAIAANSVDAIQNSRKTIVVTTHAYLKSYWCMYEFNMSRMESMFTRGGKTNLFLVMLENVPTSEIPLEMLEVIQNQSYIEYPNDEQGDVVFWDRLQQTLRPT